ncbi:MAG: hypothetical protein ACI35O_13370 [Bacillaceae bacterium]
MKRFLLLVVFLLAGCSSYGGAIDLVDTVKINGKKYDGMFNAVIRDEAVIGKKIGTVKADVDVEVVDAAYKLKDGDATYLEKGTELYAIKGEKKFIAAKDPSGVNGYVVYAYKGKQMAYDRLEKEQINKIEIYKEGSDEPTKKIVDKKEIATVVSLLNQAKNNSKTAIDDIIKGSTMFKIIFYTNDPLAYYYFILEGDGQYLWTQDQPQLLPVEIGVYID